MFSACCSRGAPSKLASHALQDNTPEKSDLQNSRKLVPEEQKEADLDAKNDKRRGQSCDEGYQSDALLRPQLLSAQCLVDSRGGALRRRAGRRGRHPGPGFLGTGRLLEFRPVHWKEDDRDVPVVGSISMVVVWDTSPW